LAILSRDLQAVQSRILPVAVQSSQQPRQQPQSQAMCHQPQHGPPSLSEFPTIEQSVTARSADQPATRGNPDWATLVSTPIAHSNRFAPLLTEEDEQNDAETDQGAYIQVSRSKNKRPRHRGSPQPARGVVRDGAAATSRRAPTVFGRSRISASEVVAAKPIRKKSVFCIDNLGTSCTADDITTYVTEELSVVTVVLFLPVISMSTLILLIISPL